MPHTMDIGHEEASGETVSAKRMCYACDINIEEIGSMSPRKIVKSIDILKRTLQTKSMLIKRLRIQAHRQKQKIENLETLLSELQNKGLLSQASSDIIQV